MVKYLLRRQSPAEPALSRCINACRHLKATQVSIAMRGRSARRKHFVRHHGLSVSHRQLVDQPSAHRADEPCIIRSRAARRELAKETVGEAVSFPYRLITNHLFTSATI